MKENESKYDKQHSENIQPQESRWFHIRKDLIIVKLVYLFIGCREGCAIPYFNLFFRDINLTVSQAGLITGLRFVGYLLGSLILGIISDQTKRYSLIMIIITLGSISLAFPQPWVPQYFNESDISITNENNSFIHTSRQIQGNVSKGWTHFELIPNSNHSYDNISQHVTRREENDVSIGQSTLFYTLLAMNTGMAFFESYYQVFIDAAIVSLNKNSPKKVDFGFQRFLGAAGFLLGSLFSGSISETFPSDTSISHYSGLYFISSGAAFSTLIWSLIWLQQKDLRKSMLKKVEESDTRPIVYFKRTIKQLPVMFFIMTITVITTLHGIDLTFLLVHQADLGSSKTEITMTIFIHALSVTLVYPVTGKIMAVCKGPLNAMAITRVLHIAIQLLVSFTSNIHLVMSTQSVYGICWCVTVAGIVEYTKIISPKEAVTSMVSLTTSITYGVSFLIANTIGGVIFQNYGGQMLFRIAAMTNIAWWLLLLVYLYRDNKKPFRGDVSVREELLGEQHSFKANNER